MGMVEGLGRLDPEPGDRAVIFAGIECGDRGDSGLEIALRVGLVPPLAPRGRGGELVAALAGAERAALSANVMVARPVTSGPPLATP